MGAGTSTLGFAFGGTPPVTAATEEWTLDAPVGPWPTGNAMNTPFRAKVLEIPNSIENPALWGDSNTPNGGSDPSQAQSGTFGLYFYIVSPPNESNYEGDITYDNFACQEWVVRPSSIEQLRLDSDDFYDELINGSIDGGGSN